MSPETDSDQSKNYFARAKEYVQNHKISTGIFTGSGLLKGISLESALVNQPGLSLAAFLTSFVCDVWGYISYNLEAGLRY